MINKSVSEWNSFCLVATWRLWLIWLTFGFLSFFLIHRHPAVLLQVSCKKKKKENVKVTKRKQTICHSFFVDFIVQLESLRLQMSLNKIRASFKASFQAEEQKPGSRFNKCIFH